MVFGKMIHPISSLSQLNASNQIVWQVLNAGKDGEMPPTKAPGKPRNLSDMREVHITNSDIVWIDVEDLAETSRKALISPTPGHERFLVTQSSYDTQEIADIIRAELPDRHRVPAGQPGKRSADSHYACDSSKTETVLGVKFRGLKESIVPLAHQLYGMN